MKKYDYLILGSGIAGLTCALKLAESGKVAIITKKNRAESNTNYAQGGIACVTSEEDTFEMHLSDTLIAGDGLCREQVVRDIVAEGPERIQELIRLGVRFSEREGNYSGQYDLGKEGGHSKRRVLHAEDMTGREIERALLHAIDQHRSIEVLENHVAVDLITSNKIGCSGSNRVMGAYVLDRNRGEVETFAAPVVVLATGGSGKCYQYTTNPDIASGDGVAMAYRAGVRVANMEFVQFHPTCLFHPFAKSFLISEALRGEGGILIDEHGQDMVRRYDPRGSLAPRDVVARAIDAEMKRTGAECARLDMTSKSAEFLRLRFPNIYEFCLGLGLDMAKQPLPVVPAAHYQCGGVLTGTQGDTDLSGLYAIGEVACTGLHGANRLASNSLLEAVVTSHRAALHGIHYRQSVAAEPQPPLWSTGDAHDPDEMVVVTHNWREIRQTMWDYVGIVRTDKRLRRAATRLSMLHQEVHEYYWNFKVSADLLELRNLVLVASLIVESALRRKESRGLHYTLDYPEKLPVAVDTIIEPGINSRRCDD
ncbi:MAG: L-aspartate oxidase [Candidatus Methylacidiphilales bacterium]